MSVKLVAKTTPLLDNISNAEALVAYTARVSSPNQENPEYSRLLTYCIRNGHWSVFELADLCFEISTTRDISAQILRHRSFTFQEFSTRYAKVEGEIQLADTRVQDNKNRQNSFKSQNPATIALWQQIQEETYQQCAQAYEAALSLGIAKELARKVLPLQTPTRMYMKGNIRSWIHYCVARCDKSTQKEHRDIANAIWQTMRKEFPTISVAAESIYPALNEVPDAGINET